MAVDLRVNIGSLSLKNPVLTASGTFGYGLEYAEVVDLSRLGGIVVKGLSLEPCPGNPPPRTVETPAGMLNAIGLQNIGLKAFLEDKLPALREFDTAIVVNIWGEFVDDYLRLAEALAEADGVAALELNVSCPNKEGKVMCLGQSAEATAGLVEAVKRVCDLPLWVKLTPNVTDHTPIARAAEAAGAEAISLINTLLGLAVNARTRRPELANVVGGLSGPAVKPVALRMVWQAARAVDIPIVGVGGIMSGIDAAEFIVAGATAVQVGTANFVNPTAAVDVIDELTRFMEEEGVARVGDLVGSLIVDA